MQTYRNCVLSLSESFSFDLAQVESSVVVHECDDCVELLIYEGGFV